MKLCPYWTSASLTQADNAVNFRQLGEIALEVMRSLPVAHAGSKEGIVQVCGPVSTGGMNSPKLNFLVLSEAVRKYRELGIRVFDQTSLEKNFVRLWEEWKQINPDLRDYCWPILDDVYKPLFRSGLVTELHFLPGWEWSVGSCWERSQGLSLKLKVLDYPSKLYGEILSEHNLSAK